MENHEHFENTLDNSTLHVNSGIEQPENTNLQSILKFKNIAKKKLSIDDYINGILKSDRTILSKTITLIESSLPEHRQMAQEIVEKCLPFSEKSIRIGITGVPGVGKSSFIETFGMHLTSIGKKLAVLAIDPSSERSGGSILGDKTRMEKLSINPSAFIRPSPSSGTLGGVARKTRESIIVCEAAGYDMIFVETVGVGQSETTVHSMVDFFLLLMLAGAGDELQGIKRGIMEMADALVITKSDGSNIQKAELAKAQYQNALHLFPPTESGWIPPVLTCSAFYNMGIEKIWETIHSYYKFTINNQYFTQKRRSQSKHWMYETINETLYRKFYQEPKQATKIKKVEQLVLEGKITSFSAANQLLSDYFKCTSE